MRVLLVEDDRRVAEVVRRGLEHSGFAVDVTSSGRDSLRDTTEHAYDVVVLDLNLPDIDGMEVCRRLRHRGEPTPMLMLSSRRGVSSRVEGLDVGADDYLPKPFALPEVVARVRALARRNPTPPARRPGTVLAPDGLLASAWDVADEPQSNVVAVYVRYLRNKLDRPFGRASIATVRGHGYRYDPAA